MEGSFTDQTVGITEKNSDHLVVDSTKTLEQAIADGNYGWINSQITEKHFPDPAEISRKKVEVSATLFSFKGAIKTEAVLEIMDKYGYRPANLRELLALGASFPELQKKFRIIALGSVWCEPVEKNNLVPYLDKTPNYRILDLVLLCASWTAHCHFLGIRKI